MDIINTLTANPDSMFNLDCGFGLLIAICLGFGFFQGPIGPYLASAFAIFIVSAATYILVPINADPWAQSARAVYNVAMQQTNKSYYECSNQYWAAVSNSVKDPANLTSAYKGLMEDKASSNSCAAIRSANQAAVIAFRDKVLSSKGRDVAAAASELQNSFAKK